jgi:hypothetical protein
VLTASSARIRFRGVARLRGRRFPPLRRAEGRGGSVAGVVSDVKDGLAEAGVEAAPRMPQHSHAIDNGPSSFRLVRRGPSLPKRSADGWREEDVVSNASCCLKTAARFAELAKQSGRADERAAYRELERLWSAMARVAERFDREHDSDAKARIYSMIGEVQAARQRVA